MVARTGLLSGVPEQSRCSHHCNFERVQPSPIVGCRESHYRVLSWSNSRLALLAGMDHLSAIPGPVGFCSQVLVRVPDSSLYRTVDRFQKRDAEMA